MFFSQHILTKKGPLAKIWLAAHMHNKLTKAMVFSTNIASAVARIIQPDAPMALRLTSNLLLGVVRIFSRKAKYLLADSSDAMARLKLAYTATSSNDLEEGAENANAITLHGGAVDDIIGMPLSELDLFQSASNTGRGSQSATPRYLADVRDITIDEYASGGGLGIMDVFGMDPDLDLLPVSQSGSASRGRLLDHPALSQDDLEAEPLIFTPSQQRTPSKSQEGSAERTGARALSDSVEAMRDAPSGTPRSNRSIEMMRDGEPVRIGTPRISLDIDLDNNGELEKDGDGGNIPPTTPPAMARNMPQDEAESPVVLSEMREALSTAYGGNRGEAQSPAPKSSMDAEPEAGSPNGAPGSGDLLPQDELMLASEPSTPQSRDDVANHSLRDAQTRSGHKHGAKVAPSRRVVRKRKASALVQMDHETELTANFFRHCLHDTSDIVGVHKRVRLRADAMFDVSEMELHGASAVDIFSRPAFPGLASELNEVFARCLNAQNVLKQRPRGRDEDVAGGDNSESASEPSSTERRKDTSARRGSEELENEKSQFAIVTEDQGQDTGRISLPSVGLESGNRTSDLEANDLIDLPSNLKASMGLHGLDELAPYEDREGSIRLSTDNAFETNLSPRGPVVDKHSTACSNALGKDSIHVPKQNSVAGDEPVVGRDYVTRPAKMISLLDVANTSSQHSPYDSEGPAVEGYARMTARALKMRDYLAPRVGEDGSVCFTDELQKEGAVCRRTAARSFYELLNLCSRRIVTLDQDTAYGSIRVVLVEPASQPSPL